MISLPKSEKFNAGFDTILKSKHFMTVLEVVLAIGNFMNYGGRSGGTVGFDVSILTKLADTKANGGGTLLEFVISTIEAQYPAAMSWTTEMGALRDYKTSSWEKIDLGVKELKAQTVLVRNLSRQVEIGSSDKFGEIITKIEQCDTAFEKTKALAETTQKRWEELAEKFAKDAVGLKPEGFFVELNEAIDSFEKAVSEKKKRMVAQEKQKNKDKAQEEMRRLQIKNAQVEAKLKSTIKKKGEAPGEDGKEAEALSSMLSSLSGSMSARTPSAKDGTTTPRDSLTESGTLTAREREEARKQREERKRQLQERRKELQKSIANS